MLEFKREGSGFNVSQDGDEFLEFYACQWVWRSSPLFEAPLVELSADDHRQIADKIDELNAKELLRDQPTKDEG